MAMSTYNELNSRAVPAKGIPVSYNDAKDMSQRVTTHQTAVSREIISTSMNPNSIPEEPYDIPRSINNIPHVLNTTPNASISSLLSCDCSLTSSSLNNISDYDIPRKIPIPIRSLHQPPESAVIAKQPFGTDQNSHHQVLTVYNTPLGLPLQSKQMFSAHDSLNMSLIDPGLSAKDVSFETSIALNILAKLQKEANLTTSRLLSYVMTKRNDHGKFIDIVAEVRPIIRGLRIALNDLLKYMEKVAANVNSSDNPHLGQKLNTLIVSLKDSDQIIERSSNSFCCPEEINKFPENIEQLITCSQSIVGDVRSALVFIQNNAVQLFKPNQQFPKKILSPCFDNMEPFLEAQGCDNDTELGNIIKGMQTNMNINENADIPKMLSNNTAKKSQLDELNHNERLLVKLSIMQALKQVETLQLAVDAFLETVEKNQQPKLFMAHGKFVVINAHNLLIISSVIHRKLSRGKTKDAISHCGELLAEGLQTYVLHSKKATIHFPSVTVVQDMVDSVIEISYLAFNLKATILQAL